MASDSEESSSSVDEVRKETVQSDIEEDDEDELSLLHNQLQPRSKGALEDDSDEPMEGDLSAPRKSGRSQVRRSGASRRREYKTVGRSNTVEKVLNELRTSDDEIGYRIKFEDGRKEKVSER